MDGKPFDSEQDEDELEAPESTDFEGRHVEIAKRDEDEGPKDELGKRLKFSGEWVAEPVHPDQEYDYPDSVRTKRLFIEVLNASDPADQVKYTQYAMSNKRRGSIVFQATPDKEFVPELKTWLIFMQLEEREFKSL
jgi:hypothetical protein